MKKVALETYEVATGPRQVNGRAHGFRWEPRYRLVLEFESKEEAEEALRRLTRQPLIPYRCADK